MNNVRVIPTQANRIRALKVAEPSLTPDQLARRLGTHRNIVNMALEKADIFRPKSVAK
jgi:hypothetical protein